MLRATTLMVYTVPLCSPLSTVLVAVAGSCSGVEPLLGTAVTVYPVTGGLLSGSVGGVHVTLMDEPEVAMADTPPGGGGAEQKDTMLLGRARWNVVRCLQGDRHANEGRGTNTYKHRKWKFILHCSRKPLYNSITSIHIHEHVQHMLHTLKGNSLHNSW